MAVVALLLVASSGSLDAHDFGVQAATVKAKARTDMIDEDDDASEVDKVDNQIL